VERGLSETRCGFVALIGAPNAGKSTLINALVGEKVSIVSRKAQTTRSTVRGVLTLGDAQIVFVDTPGMFAPKRRLERAMTASAWGAAADADVLALIVDARKEAAESSLTDETGDILEALEAHGKPKVLILNKIDAMERGRLLELSARLNGAAHFDETFMISAATGDGLDRLKSRLVELIPAGPWHYPEDQIAEAPIRSLAAEITREKLFDRLHDELPYQATVETDSWKDQADGSARIEQTIFVTRESHRKIVIGEGGRTIKAIGTAARKDIAEAHGANVHLFLHVKVRENWLDDPERYRAMGLEFPKG
jgi:GTPase